jgi:alcohol dehydrogenase class IV
MDALDPRGWEAYYEHLPPSALDELDVKAVRLIFENLEAAYKDGDEPDRAGRI